MKLWRHVKPKNSANLVLEKLGSGCLGTFTLCAISKLCNLKTTTIYFNTRH